MNTEDRSRVSDQVGAYDFFSRSNLRNNETITCSVLFSNVSYIKLEVYTSKTFYDGFMFNNM